MADVVPAALARKYDGLTYIRSGVHNHCGGETQRAWPQAAARRRTLYVPENDRAAMHFSIFSTFDAPQTARSDGTIVVIEPLSRRDQTASAWVVDAGLPEGGGISCAHSGSIQHARKLMLY